MECKANPDEGFAGDLINVSATLSNFDARKTPVYKWVTTGGTMSAPGQSIVIQTKGLRSGTYSATAHVYEGSKKQEIASCTASFSVKPIPPPTISCSSDPTTVNPGDSSTITSIASSPANRPLSYSYATSAGQVAGDTPKAVLMTAGVAPGVVTVICAATDDIGQKATSPTTVTVASPAMPPPPKAQGLCELTFYRDKKRPSRVDNESRAWMTSPSRCSISPKQGWSSSGLTLLKKKRV